MSMRYQLSLILSCVKTIMQLLRGTFSTELFCMNKNSPTLQNMHVCLFFSVMTWDFFRVSECCGNERFVACCDVLLYWIPFKALGTDLHAAPLPGLSRFFHMDMGLCLISWSFHSITPWEEKAQAIWRRLFIIYRLGIPKGHWYNRLRAHSSSQFAVSEFILSSFSNYVIHKRNPHVQIELTEQL